MSDSTAGEVLRGTQPINDLVTRYAESPAWLAAVVAGGSNAELGCLALRGQDPGVVPRLLDQQPEPKRQQHQREPDSQYR